MMYWSRRLALSASVAILGTQPAFAIDGATLVAGLKAQAAISGASLEVGTIEETGPDSFRLLDLEIAGNGMAKPLQVKSVEANGVREISGKSIMIDSLKFGGISLDGKTDKGDEFFMTVDGGEGTNLYFPDPNDLDAPLLPSETVSYRIGRMSMNISGAEVMTISGIKAITEKAVDGNEFSTEMSVSEMTIDLSQLKDTKAKAQMQALGLEKLSTEIRLVGSFNLDTGRMELSEYSFDTANVGKLGMTMAIDGYDMALLRKVRETTLEANKAGKNDPEAQKAAAAKLMSILSELKLAGATLSFDDQSIVGKVLDMQAAATGSTREELVQMAPVMAMGMTQALDNPEFSAMVSEALARFAGDPKSLTITLAPAEPVAFAQIVGTAISGPPALIGLLGVSVKANE
ncbi:MAG: hypothetical protein KDJ48_15850 [Nitratireductor sp.]|nr:hypothetical protein [Nitratireductor sp.]